MRDCQNLDEVRESIDQLDQHIIQLLSERSQYVRQAAARVESVIHKVRQLAVEHALNPSIAEKVYRAMIAGFIEDELQEHERINPSNR